MADVTWRDHPLYAHYQASSDGRIRSVDHLVPASRGNAMRNSPGRERRSGMTTNGYKGLSISVEGTSINVRVHRFVCEAFHGAAPFERAVVRHLNGIKTDNRPDNLTWGTYVENGHDTIVHGRHRQSNKTHCPEGHEYTPENTYTRPSRPGRERACRKCIKARDALRILARKQAA